MELTELSLDTKKIDDGDWVHVPALDSDLFAIGLRSEKFRRMLARKRKKARENSEGDLDDYDDSMIFAQTLVEAKMIRDWRPLTNDKGEVVGKGLTENGKAIPFTDPLFAKLMREREWEDVQNSVVLACKRVGRRQAEVLEEDLGNSGRGSERG